jgi:hypothetical protein
MMMAESQLAWGCPQASNTLLGFLVRATALMDSGTYRLNAPMNNAITRSLAEVRKPTTQRAVVSARNLTVGAGYLHAGRRACCSHPKPNQPPVRAHC